MLPDRVSNPGPLTYESGALLIAIRGPAGPLRSDSVIKLVSDLITESDQAVRAVHICKSWLDLLFKKITCSLTPMEGNSFF